jgi:hypothetical protein
MILRCIKIGKRTAELIAPSAEDGHRVHADIGKLHKLASKVVLACNRCCVPGYLWVSRGPGCSRPVVQRRISGMLTAAIKRQIQRMTVRLIARVVRGFRGSPE